MRFLWLHFPTCVFGPSASQHAKAAGPEHGINGDVPRGLQRSVSVGAVRGLSAQRGASVLSAHGFWVLRTGTAHCGILWSAVSHTRVSRRPQEALHALLCSWVSATDTVYCLTFASDQLKPT